jgi:hypothetical protein
MNSMLVISDVVAQYNAYFDSHTQSVNYKTLARKMNVTPKQSRYVLRTFFGGYRHQHRHYGKVYYKKTVAAKTGNPL